MYFRNSYCKTDKIGTTENEKKKRGTAFNTTYNNAIYVKNINISYELAFQCFVN